MKEREKKPHVTLWLANVTNSMSPRSYPASQLLPFTDSMLMLWSCPNKVFSSCSIILPPSLFIGPF